MPHLVRFLIRHAVIGFGVALVFVAILLALDALGLRSLMARGPDGWLAAGVLAFAMGLTSAACRWAWPSCCSRPGRRAAGPQTPIPRHPAATLAPVTVARPRPHAADVGPGPPHW